MYKGKKKRWGLTAMQAAIVALAALITVMAGTIHAASEWTGMSEAEILWTAITAEADW